MSSLMHLFGKKHLYESQNDLSSLTAEQIVRLSPSDVSSSIDSRGTPLQGVKKRALYRLLAIKKMEKASPNETARQDAIRRFLVGEGLQNDPAVDNLIMNSYKDVMTQKTMEKRLRQLQDKPVEPFTSEEELFQRVNRLTRGGRRRRAGGSKKYRHKTSRRATKKTHVVRSRRRH